MGVSPEIWKYIEMLNYRRLVRGPNLGPAANNRDLRLYPRPVAGGGGQGGQLTPP